MFPHTRPYTNRAVACTDDYNGRSSRASSWRERAPSRTGWVSKHSQKDVDSSGKAQAPIGPVVTGLWLMNVTY